MPGHGFALGEPPDQEENVIQTEELTDESTNLQQDELETDSEKDFEELHEAEIFASDEETAEEAEENEEKEEVEADIGKENISDEEEDLKESKDSPKSEKRSKDRSSPLTVSMIHFDSAVDNGSTPLPSSSDSIKNYDRKTDLNGNLTLQINYTATELDRDYAIGEFRFKVYGLEKFGLMDPVKANKLFSATHHKGTLSDETGNVEDDYWIFTNKNKLNEADSIDGMVQLVYKIADSDSGCPLNDSKGYAYVEFNGETISETYYEFHLKKSDTRASVSPGAIKMISRFENGEDYYWVRYNMNQSSKANIAYMITGENSYEYIEVPEDLELYYFQDISGSSCRVLGEPYYKLVPFETDNGLAKYRIETSQEENGTNTIFAGYPKSRFSAGDTVNLSVDFYGKYNRKSGYTVNILEKEYSHLASVTSNNFRLREYTPPDPGTIYTWSYLSNPSHNSLMPSSMSLRDRLGKCGDFSYITVYNDEPMDIVYGWDIAGISIGEGEYRMIDKDDVYLMDDTLRYPSYLRDLNGVLYEPGTIETELYIRLLGSDDYVLAETITNGAKYHNYINEGKKITGYYWKIKSVPPGGLFFSTPNDISARKLIYAEPDTYDASGNVLSSAYLSIYDEEGRLLTRTENPENYPEELQQMNIPERDMSEYGMYMNRMITLDEIKPDKYMGKGGINFLSRTQGEGSNKWLMTLSFGIDKTNSVNRIYGYDAYMDLPAICKTKPKEIKKAISDNIDKLSGRNSTGSELNALSGVDEREEWIRDYLNRLTIEMKDDADGNGTKVLHFHLDYNEGLDISGYIGKLWSIVIPVTVYDTEVLEYGGDTSTNVLHKPILPNGAELGKNDNVNSNGNSENLFNIYNETWTGKTEADINDVDGDGDLEEKFLKIRSYGNLMPAFEAHLEMTKLLKTDKNYFKTGASNVSKSTDYTYRLRVRSAALGMKDLVIYDNIENYRPEGAENWKGSFQGIDLSRTEIQGHVPDIYYSSSGSPGKLGEDQSWQAYTQNTDKSQVKALAFDFKDQMIEPNRIVSVDILMKSPEEDTDDYAYNKYTAEWNRVDTETGHVFSEREVLDSNVTILSVKEDISDQIDINIIKEWQDEPTDWEGRPDNVKVKLLRDGEKYGDTKTLKSSDGWRATISSLPRFADDGHEYDYTVTENDVPGYRQEIITNGQDCTIINHLEMKKLTVSNTVEGNMGDKHKKFRFTLNYGSDAEHAGETKEFSLAHGETFEMDLPYGKYYKVTVEDTDYKVTYEKRSGKLVNDTECKVVNIKNAPIQTGVDPMDHTGIILGMIGIMIISAAVRKKGIKNP